KNSGLSKHDTDALIAAGNATKQFGVSKTEGFHTLRELQASLGSAHHAVEALPVTLRAVSGLQLYNRSHSGNEIDNAASYSMAKLADERGGATSPEEMEKQMNLAFKGVT